MAFALVPKVFDVINLFVCNANKCAVVNATEFEFLDIHHIIAAKGIPKY